MWQICKKEWQQFFSSITGIMVPVIFLLLSGLLLFVFPDTSLLVFGYAQLDQFFNLMPWLLVFLIPAISMRSIADEQKLGTLETLFTLPISKTAIILGKYLGVLGITILTLLPTIIYAFSMQALSITGGIDIGATIGSYCSLFLLAAVYAAISLLASALTKNNMAAFVMGAFLCLTVHSGFTAISKLPFLAVGADYYIQILGIQYHTANMSRGVISASDMIYFLAISIFCIYLTIYKLQQIKYRFWLAGLLLMIAVFGSAYIRFQIDLTQEKRFTLSKSTIQLLHHVDSTIRVEVLLAGKLPADYKKLAIATENMLAAFKNYASIEVSFKEPGADISNDSLKAQLYDSLARLGVVFERSVAAEDAGNTTVTKLIIPSALVYFHPNQLPVAVDLRSSKKVYKQFNIITDEPKEDIEATRNAAEALLENKFAVAIDKLTRKNIPTVAYVVGNGEPVDLTVNDLGQSLRNDYRLGIFDLKKGYPDASIIQTLIIVKPTIAFTEEDLVRLDQYIMHGGNIFWCIDKLYAELDSLKRPNINQYTAFDRGLNLDEILFKYGVRINGDLLQDLSCSKIPLVVGKNPDGSIRMQRMPWPYYPFLSSRTPNPISQNIDRVLPIFPSSIDTVAAPGIRKTILLASDTNSRSIASPAIVSLNSVQSETDLLQFNRSYVPVAVMLEGKFHSLFSNRLSKSSLDSIQQKTGKAFMAQAEKAGKQIVVADADIVTNQISNTTGPLPMGTIPLEDYRFGNREFFLNSIDYLSGSTNLFESRNKTVVLRLLDKQKLTAQKTFWQLLNTLLPVLLVMACGWLFQQYRKKQFGIN